MIKEALKRMPVTNGGKGPNIQQILQHLQQKLAIAREALEKMFICKDYYEAAPDEYYCDECDVARQALTELDKEFPEG